MEPVPSGRIEYTRVKPMTGTQLYLAIGLPILFNAAMFTLFSSMLNRRMDDKFESVNKRFDDMRDLWRAELRRVEEIFDARLTRIENTCTFAKEERTRSATVPRTGVLACLLLYCGLEQHLRRLAKKWTGRRPGRRLLWRHRGAGLLRLHLGNIKRVIVQ